MQSTTGCKINVSQASGADIEREIGLVGTRQAIDDAKRAIWDKVEQVVSQDRLFFFGHIVLTLRRRKRTEAGVVVVEITGTSTTTHINSSQVTANHPTSHPVSQTHHSNHKMVRPLIHTPSMAGTRTILPCGIPRSHSKQVRVINDPRVLKLLLMPRD